MKIVPVRMGKRRMELYTLPDELTSSAGAALISDVAPARIMEIELGEALPVITTYDAVKGKYYRRVLCLVRLHTQRLGVVEFTLAGEISAGACAEQIWSTLGEQINKHLLHDGLPPVTELSANGLPATGTPGCIEEREQFLAHAPFVSVIVPTHGRPDFVQTCLHALADLHYPHYEVVIV